MSQPSFRRQRLQALVEVIHAVLVSVEEAGESEPGQSRLERDWGEIVAGVQNRLRTGGDWPAESATPDPAPASRPAPVSPPPAPPPGSDTIEFFLSASREPREDAAPPPPPPARREEDASSTLDDFFNVAGVPSTHEERASPDPVSAEQPAASPADAVALAAECDRLREANRVLEERLAAGGASSPGTGGPAAVLDALGVTAPPPGDDLDAAVAEVLGMFAHYFAKTRGNLAHVFGGLKIPVRIPDLPRIVEASLSDRAKLETHLEDLRECWKTLVAGTWNNLFQWCRRIETDFSPETIEKSSQARREAPWDVYKDTFNRMALYDNLAELLRSKIKAHMRKRLPHFLK